MAAVGFPKDSNRPTFVLRTTGAASPKIFKIQFKKERNLNKEKLTSEGIREISFELVAPDGLLCLDDLKLVPQG